MKKAIFTLLLLIGVTMFATAATQTVKFQVKGITCNACKTKINKALSHEPGIWSSSVSVSNKTVTIKYNDNKTGIARLQAVLRGLKYDSQVLSSTADNKKSNNQPVNQNNRTSGSNSTSTQRK
ncbi:MAG: heavy metal-associated domain-containing protein [bacterium]